MELRVSEAWITVIKLGCKSRGKPSVLVLLLILYIGHGEITDILGPRVGLEFFSPYFVLKYILGCIEPS